MVGWFQSNSKTVRFFSVCKELDLPFFTRSSTGDLINVGAAGGPVSVKSATDNQVQNFPYAIGLDSSEEVMFHAGELGDLVSW